MLGEIINIGFPNPDQKGELSILVADVGGTKSSLALFRVKEGEFKKGDSKKYKSGSYHTFEEIVSDFLKDKETPDRFCVGIAGPVVNGVAELTNLSWVIDERKLEEEFGIEHVYAINDLEANAFGLAGLTHEDLLTLHEGSGIDEYIRTDLLRVLKSRFQQFD